MLIDTKQHVQLYNPLLKRIDGLYVQDEINPRVDSYSVLEISRTTSLKYGGVEAPDKK